MIGYSMVKRAILIEGKPIIIEDVDQFIEESKKNLGLMKEIALREGYFVQNSSLDDAGKYIDKFSDSDKFIFYYTGHANKDHIGTLDYKTNYFLEKMKKISGDKLIILDACAGNYPGGKDFESLELPKNSKIISAKEIVSSKSLVRLLYDAVIFRNQDLDKINKETFDSMKHNWVYFKEN
jgi:hypothetical protein